MKRKLLYDLKEVIKIFMLSDKLWTKWQGKQSKLYFIQTHILICSHPQMIFSTNMTHACLINKLLTKQINYFVLETNQIVKD